MLKDKGNHYYAYFVLCSIYTHCSHVYTQILRYNTYILMKTQGIIN